MAQRSLIVDTIGLETRLAVLEDGEPVEFAVSRRDHADRLGNLYKARVMNTLRGMHAAFVNIGDEKNAFLSLDDLPPAARDAQIAQGGKPRTLLAGDEIIVQLLKEPGGDKGPKVSMNPALAGNLAVLLPTLPGSFGVSRRIADEGRRGELVALLRRLAPEGMGLIARTASETADDADLGADVAALVQTWREVESEAKRKTAPTLLYDGGDLASRAARDLQCEVTFAPFPDAVENRLEKALRRKVWLSSGAFVVIDRCEAMTVIDVNSGKFTGKKNLAETLLRLNREAAKEIARLIRLRDLGGIIVIDFVDMDAEEDRQNVLSAFEEAMAPDRAKRRVHGFTGAGLLELTRRPLWGTAETALFEECARCRGEGRVMSAAAAAHEMLRSVRRRRAGGDESRITLSVSQEVARVIQNAGLPQNVELEERRGE